VRGQELEVRRLLEPRAESLTHIAEMIEFCAQSLRRGHTSVVYTSRETATVEDAAAAAAQGDRIMQALCEIVRGLPEPPRFLVAKGGITAHQIAQDALGCDRATVLGQIRPGVPVWRLDRATRFSELVYVVFPGNVGNDLTLAEVVSLLKAG
jgi:uncharacterized protein YgbK (DUF1537 family)